MVSLHSCEICAQGIDVLTVRSIGDGFTGRDALPNLAKSEAFKLGTGSTDGHSEDAAMEIAALELHRQEAAKPKKWVTVNQINADITNTFKAVVKEVSC